MPRPSSDEILDFLMTPGLTDRDVVNYMDRAGVSAEQMADVTGIDIAEIEERVADVIDPFAAFKNDQADAATAPTDAPIETVLADAGLQDTSDTDTFVPGTDPFAAFKAEQENATAPTDAPTAAPTFVNPLNYLSGDSASLIADSLAPKTVPGFEDTVAKLTSQILGQNLTGQWKGEGKGSPEANARDMAEILSRVGIRDINDFGLVTAPKDVSVTPVYEYDYVSGSDGDVTRVPRVVGYKDSNGNAVDPSLVKTQDTYSGEGDAGTSGVAYVAPLGTQKVYGNVKTGQVLDPNYDRANVDKGIWSGTFAGKDSTHYGVQFKADGTPVFYTRPGETTNTLAQIMNDLGPVGNIALAVATGGLSIPQQIAAQMAIQVLSGKDLGDAIKSAAVSLAVAQIPGTDLMKDAGKYITDLGLDAAMTNTLTTAFNNAMVSGGKALLTGQNVGDAMLAGAATGGVNGAVNALMGNIEGFGDLTDTQKRLVTNAVTGLISGKPLDQVLINSAIAAAKSEVSKARTTTGSGDSADVISGGEGVDDLEDVLTDSGLIETLTPTDAPTDAPIEDVLTDSGLVEEEPSVEPPTEEPTPTDAPTEDDDAGVIEIVGERPLPTCAPGFHDDGTGFCVPDDDVEEDTDLLPTDAPTEDDDAGVIEIVGERPLPTCAPGFHDDGTGFCVPDDDVEEDTDLLPTDAPTEDDDAGVIEIVGERPLPTCAPGFHDDGTGFCVPDDDEEEPTDAPTCAPGFHDDGTGFCVPDDDEEITECPEGYVLNLATNTCEPAPTPKPTPVPTPRPTPKPTVKPTAAPTAAPAGFTPSGAYTSTETTDPIYASGMDDFDLFTTLPELLAGMADSSSSKKAGANSRDKTKMADGGYLDELIANQGDMSTDDLVAFLLSNTR